jgi:hypothetical protein
MVTERFNDTFNGDHILSNFSLWIQGSMEKSDPLPADEEYVTCFESHLQLCSLMSLSKKNWVYLI